MRVRKKRKKKILEALGVPENSGNNLIGSSVGKKSTHGGSRENSGRYAELKRPRRVLLNLEKEHVLFLDNYAKERKLRGRSAAARKIFDRYINRQKKA